MGLQLRKMKKKDSLRIDKIEENLSSLKDDISEIKRLLSSISKNI